MLTETDAAARLGVTPGTLRVWRCTRRYPLAWCKLGRSVRYRASEVERFITAGTVRPVETE
jgi:hypothetical protein